MENAANKRHTLFLENRNALTLGGITDVISYNEEEISAVCDWGALLIKGEHLQLDALDLETGEVSVSGTVSALVYREHSSAKSVWGRLFS